MPISRRKFLGKGALVAIAAGIPLKAGLLSAGTQGAAAAAPTAQPSGTAGPVSVPSAAKTDALTIYTKANFTAQVNTTFKIRSRTAAGDVNLMKVSDAGPVPDNRVPGKECFSLIFLTRKKLPQDVYNISHPALGKFDLLLAPVGKNKKGFLYEAVINRLH